MGDFGEALRKEREARGVALEAITKITKISNRHLVALEQEHFEVLPGGVFNRGIVRGYARVVGLNEEEWLRRFMSACQRGNPVLDDDTSWIQFAENASKAREAAQGRRPDMRLRWTGIGLLLLFLAGLIWFVGSYVHRKVSGSAHMPVATGPAVHVPAISTPAVPPPAGHSRSARSAHPHRRAPRVR